MAIRAANHVSVSHAALLFRHSFQLITPVRGADKSGERYFLAQLRQIPCIALIVSLHSSYDFLGTVVLMNCPCA